jgi:hypothetical protein
MQKHSVASKSTQPTENAKTPSSGDKLTAPTNQRGVFVTMALTMSWQLAIVILVPILAGVRLDKTLGTGTTLTLVGLGVAVIGSIAVMWRTMQVANRLPVPKLTDAQKRAIKKSYEEEDKDE